MDGYGPIIHKRRSVLSTFVIGCSAIIITVILTGGAVTMYGLNIVDRKAENIFDLARVSVDNLPAFVESLPPVLADVVNHERDPDYGKQIEVSARLVPSEYHENYYRPVVEVKNLGDEVVSLLSMRITVLNENGEPVAECNEYAATPVALDDEWRGPLMPHATPRRFRSGHCLRLEREAGVSGLTVECEISDVRIWRRPSKEGAVQPTMAADDREPPGDVLAGRI